MIINNEAAFNYANAKKQGNDTMHTIENLSDKLVFSFRRKIYQELRAHVIKSIDTIFISESNENWEAFLKLEEPNVFEIDFSNNKYISELKSKIENEDLSFDDFIKILNENVTNLFSVYCEIMKNHPSESDKITNKNFLWLNDIFSPLSFPEMKKLIVEYCDLKGIKISEELLEIPKNEKENDKVEEKVIDGTNFDNISEDSFNLDPDNVKDPTGKTVEEDDYSVKITKKNARGENLIESIIKNSLRSIIPVSNITTYGLTQFTGIDVFAPISKRPFISKNNNMSLKDRFTTTNLDYNIMYNVAPDALIFLSKYTNNRKLKLAASASPLIFQLLANFKERGNPIKFDPDNDEIDIGQLLSLFIPILVEIAKPYVPIVNPESFTNVLPQNMKALWGIGGNGFNTINQNNGRHELRRNITQPNSFN